MAENQPRRLGAIGAIPVLLAVGACGGDTMGGDAGIDATSPKDASVHDATPPGDAAVLDAAVVDAMTVSDAAAFDAGPFDASSPDAAVQPDAGEPDAGIIVVGGELMWVRQVAGPGNDPTGLGIMRVGDGNLLLITASIDAMVFGAGTPTETSLPAGAHIAKYSPAGDFLWARLVALGDVRPYQNTVSGDGSVYIAGWFSGTATFGPGTPAQTSITTAGSQDGFVARYDGSGTLQWVRSGGSPAQQEGATVGCNLSSGGIIAAFDFVGTATFSGGGAPAAVLTATNPPVGATNHALIRYDAMGDLMWIRQIGGDLDTDPPELTCLADGSVLITARYWPPVTLSLGESDENVLTTSTPGEYCARYSSDGSLLMGKQCATGIVVTASIGLPDGGWYYTGRAATAVFDPGPDQQTLNDAGSGDVFVARFAANGSIVWTRRAGGPAVESGQTMGVAPDGSAIVGGGFRGTAVFGPGESNQIILSPASIDTSDMFVARFAPTGNLLWARRAGGGAIDDASRMAVLPDGTSVVTGRFGWTATFGPGEANETQVISAGQGDVFLARFAP